MDKYVNSLLAFCESNNFAPVRILCNPADKPKLQVVVNYLQRQGVYYAKPEPVIYTSHIVESLHPYLYPNAVSKERLIRLYNFGFVFSLYSRDNFEQLAYKYPYLYN